jgi:hypothetical protein
MKRTFIIGVSAAVIGGLGLWLGELLGLTFQNTVIGVGAGVIVAIVKLGSPIVRLGGFFIGFVLGVFFSAMQLGLLPGGASVAGTAVSLAVVMLVITLISGLTSARISAWTMVLGALTFLCGFLGVAETTPWTAAQQLPSYFCTLLAMAMIGFLTIIPAELLADGRATASPAKPPVPTPPAAPNPNASATHPGQQPTPASVGIDEIIGGGQ